MKPALILMDLQIDFLADSGRMPIGAANAERVIAIANSMAEMFTERRWPVIVVFNQFRRDDLLGNFFRRHAAVEGSEGGKLDPRIVVHDARHFFKAQSSAFSNPDFCAYLQQAGIDSAVICGVYAEGCVRTTAFDALKADLAVTVIADGVSSRRNATCKWALSNMGKRGVQLLTFADYLQRTR